MWTPETLHLLTPVQFESLVETLWKRMDCAIVRRPVRGADGGIDVLAKTRTTPELTLSIQAKAYQQENRVGVREIREYASLKQRHGIDAVIVVTTSSFTRQAQEEAKEFEVKLCDGSALVDLLNKYQVPCLESTQTEKGKKQQSQPPASSSNALTSTDAIAKTMAYQRAIISSYQVTKPTPNPPTWADIPIRWGLRVLCLLVGFFSVFGTIGALSGDIFWAWLFLLIPGLLVTLILSFFWNWPAAL